MCVCFIVSSLGNDLARCLRWGGGYEGESIPKLLDKIARSDIVMMDRWNITIETNSDKEENSAIPPHKVLKVSEQPMHLQWTWLMTLTLHSIHCPGNALGECSKSRWDVSKNRRGKICDKSIRTSSKSFEDLRDINRKFEACRIKWQ